MEKKKLDFGTGEIVQLDKDFNNTSFVIVEYITKNNLIAGVLSMDRGEPSRWSVLTNRLTKPTKNLFLPVVVVCWRYEIEELDLMIIQPQPVKYEPVTMPYLLAADLASTKNADSQAIHVFGIHRGNESIRWLAIDDFSPVLDVLVDKIDKAISREDAQERAYKCPVCGNELRCGDNYSGVKCSNKKCDYWFCY